MADVRDLLIRMTLDTSTFKTNIADAKRELKTLKSEYRAISASDDIGQGGEKLLSNLREQKTAAEALVKEYQTGIEEIRAKLNTVPAGSQAASQMQSQVQTLEDGLARAQEQVENLQNQINGIRLDTFITHAETVASTISNLRLGLGEVFDAAGRAADSADETHVSREAAFTSATKNVEDTHQTQADLDALNDGLREMTTRIPQTYQELAALLEAGATLGVAYDDLTKFTEVMAKLNVATNVDGKGGAMGMAQFINITEKDYTNIDRLGSTLVELGNNSATTEQNILDMAQNAATGLNAVGMSAQDILAVSAALNSVGIEAQAGGSAVSRLAIEMDKAAKADPEKAAKFGAAMGQTAEEFSRAWNEDSASQMLAFFRALGEMDGSEGENMLLWMDDLGIKEIRQSNMVRALSGNWELYARMLGLARDAYEENVALENEANRAFSTNESRRVINQNKEQNALEKMGQTVTEMRKPWEDFFADLQQWYADWPGWAQTAVGAAAEGAKNLGGLLEGAGKAAFSILSISKAIKEIEQSTLGGALLKRLAAAGGAVAGAATTVLPGALFIGGSMELGRQVNNAYTEETFGGANAAIERTGELLDTAGGKMTRLQELFQTFAEATNEDNPDWLTNIKTAWDQYGDELLAMFPELQKDVHDNMDAFDWMILGSNAVEQLAAGIDAEKQGLYDSGYAAGLDMQAGVAQGIYDGMDETLAAAGYVRGQIEDMLYGGLNGYTAPTGGQSAPTAGGAQKGQNASPQPQTAQITINVDGKTMARTMAPLVDQVMGDAMFP